MSLTNCKNILITVDFSADSKEAVEEGLALAKVLGADVTLLHVVHDSAESPGVYHKKKDQKKMLRLMSDAAGEMLDEFIKAGGYDKAAKKNKTKLSTALSRGIPSAQIINAAAKAKAGLIVMGSAGRTGLSHLLLGSTAERVVQLSPIPVLVVTKTKGDKKDK